MLCSVQVEVAVTWVKPEHILNERVSLEAMYTLPYHFVCLLFPSGIRCIGLLRDALSHFSHPRSSSGNYMMN
jgi:hypothetical protein